VRTEQVVGAVLLLLGLTVLYLLRDSLLRLIVFFLEFFGIIIGLVLLFAGLALLFGLPWMTRGSMRAVYTLEETMVAVSSSRQAADHGRVEV